MKDYVPDKDLEFDAWQHIVMNTSKENATTWAIEAADITSLEVWQAAWVEKFAKVHSPEGRHKGDVPEKNDARRKYKKELRKFIRHNLSSNPLVPLGDRERMGLTIRKGTRTPSVAPKTCPVATIDFSVRLEHSIGFVDEAGKGKAKPKGVYGCQIWIKVGEAPNDFTELTFVAMCTKTPYRHQFESADIGKTAHYRLCWVNARGKEGPWSSVVDATVTG
jgi:hypothetical protein